MTTFYIGGPMRGQPNYGFQEFEDAELALVAMRYEAVSPHTIDMDEGLVRAEYEWGPSHEGCQPENWDRRVFSSVVLADDFDYHTAIKRDLHELTACDAIALLDGWEYSQGACAEREVAKLCNLPTYYLNDMLGEWSLFHDDESPTIDFITRQTKGLIYYDTSIAKA